jgi:hypothetical protein
VEITKKKIEEKIDSLKSESAPGPDGIHPKLLKEMKNWCPPRYKLYLENR